MANFNELKSEEIVEKTAASLKNRGYEVEVLENGQQALERIKEIIPPQSSVMNGSSVTLEKIGFVEYLKSGTHPWNNLHDAILKETDPVKKSNLRKQASLSDYYLGSVHALTETGEFIIASQSGSQLPHIVYTSPNIIFIISTKKIVSNLEEGMKRLYEHVIPLEEKHMQEKYGVGTAPNKIVIFNGESKSAKRKIVVLLIKEDLGF